MQTSKFGYEDVTPDEKTRRVRGVFDSVARKYDVMNDLMSAGMHRGWKRFTVEVSGVRPGARVIWQPAARPSSERTDRPFDEDACSRSVAASRPFEHVQRGIEFCFVVRLD